MSEIWGAYFREGLFIYLFIYFFWGGGYYRNLPYLKQAHGRRVEGGGFTEKGEAIAFSLAIICFFLTFFLLIT